MPVSNVAASAPATSSWANSVADAITELEGDLYPSVYGQLAIPWASLTGVPSTFTPTVGAVTAETSYGGASSNGVGTAAARNDHKHGTPALPTPTQVGAWAKLSAGGGAAGTTIHVGTTAPASPVEGDVWIKG